MKQPDSQIRNISDTARWVAVYRARETERPDAVFRDLFARRLAGERGQQIAASIPFAEKHSWPFVARTWLVDQLINDRSCLCGHGFQRFSFSACQCFNECPSAFAQVFRRVVGVTSNEFRRAV